MIDVVEEINAVTRRVGSRVLEAGEARTVTISRTYDAAIDDLWDALTNPDRIPRWFLPISGDLRVDGHYQLEGNAGGTIQRCDPPNSFAATWEFGGTVTWIEVRLVAESAQSTRFELDHIAHVDDVTWTDYGPGAVGVGWDLGLRGLGIHMASGETVDANEMALWSASDEGKRFAILSSQTWCDADIAAGANPADAKAAADRTAAAYTASPPPAE